MPPPGASTRTDDVCGAARPAPDRAPVTAPLVPPAPDDRYRAPSSRIATAARARHEAVARPARARRNRNGEERIGGPAVAAGKQPDRDPALLDGPPAGRLHYPAAPAAHEDRPGPGQGPADGLGLGQQVL